MDQCGKYIVFVMLLSLQFLTGLVRADVLVTKSGSRYAGKVVDKGSSYVLIKPGGGKITFPKSMVEEVIRSEDAKAEFETMLKKADVRRDKDIASLCSFAEKKGLVKEREKILKSAYAIRRAAAQGEAQALRALAVWCQKYRLASEAKACQLDAYRLEFVPKFAAAGTDTKRLEELAKWCTSCGLKAEAGKCLSGQYALRKQQANSAQEYWKLADWCDRYGQQEWRDQQRTAAITAALTAKDEKTLLEFLRIVAKKKDAAGIMHTCGRALYQLRHDRARNDPIKLAQLANWCRAHGLKAEGDAAEAAALKPSPDAPAVRRVLGQIRNEATGQWRTAPKLMIAGPWKLTVASVKVADSYSDDSSDGMSVKSKPTNKVLVVTIKLEATRAYKPAELRAIESDSLCKTGLRFMKALGGHLLLHNGSVFFALQSRKQITIASPIFVCSDGISRMSITAPGGASRTYFGFCQRGKSGTVTLAFPVATTDRRPGFIFSPTGKIEHAKGARIVIHDDGTFDAFYCELQDLAKMP